MFSSSILAMPYIYTYKVHAELVKQCSVNGIGNGEILQRQVSITNQTYLCTTICFILL